ncbi:MAG: di-heme oxidoredictase family protein, partial [Nitrospiria bacterium]
MIAGRASAWVACALVALLSAPAQAQVSERPGTSRDTSLGPKDVTGRSIKDRRVRVVHTDDPSVEGGSRFLQDVDPWLAYQRGKNLTQREFRARDGVFGRAGLFFDPKLLGDRVTPRLGRDHVSSCGMCHNVPYRDGGAGVTFPKGGGEGRNTPHFFGAGLIEMLGLQTRLKVLQACDPARRGFVAVADAPPGPILIEPATGAVPIDFGRCRDSDGDGRPDLNKIFRVWYVDREGRRVLEDANGDGAIDLRDPTVIGYNLEMMVFGWGETDGAMAPTLRVFFTDPIDTHTGMQAYDPTLQIDDGAHGDDGPGDGLARVSNAGARQFAIHAPADRGTRLTAQGLSLDDPDGDGAITEISEGDVDLAEWYLLHAPPPALDRQTPQTRRGRALMAAWRCTSCHTPQWSIYAADPSNADPYRRYDGDRRFFDLPVEYQQTADRLEGTLVSLADPREGGGLIPRRGAATVANIFSDLKHHEMGDAFAETLFNGARVRQFRTAPLWGVGTSAPYGHDGASLTLDAVIRRHGGEARESTERY